MYVPRIKEKKAMNLKERWKKVYETAWREEREGNI